MPWCPKCRKYQEEDDLCSYCWVELVDALPPEPREPENEVFLISVGDENEANIIQNLLDIHQIPSLKKYRDIGGYMKVYMGTSAFGVDIYVPESCVETAVELLRTDTSFDETMPKDIEPTQSSYEPEKKKNVARLLLLFILIPLVAGLLLNIIDFFMQIAQFNQW